MKKWFTLFLIFLLTAFLGGCIVKAAPDPGTQAVMSPGMTIEFSVSTGFNSSFIWSVDGKVITDAKKNYYIYSPSSSDIGVHALAVSVCSFWGSKEIIWKVCVIGDASDTGLPGPYQSEPIDYGCDPNKFPHAYPSDCPCTADPQARTMDISEYLATPDLYVSMIRGISMHAVPLHALGYMPDGIGPFPLALIVHGNRMPWEISFYGYDYLARHLASHGYIALAIEEDFLNGFANQEIDARAIVLLGHLQLLREWSRPGSVHPLAGKIDMRSIALVGHSRGGEAVAAAWYLNTALHDPDDPYHDFNFNIKSLCALAPTDGLFELDGIGKVSVVLHDVHYLVMHGSHDGDVHGFQGMRMYDRAFGSDIPVSGEKAMLFIHRADHAGWNTVWARNGDPYAIRPQDPSQTALPPGDQQAIGKTCITAWLKWTLSGDSACRGVFTGETMPSSLPSGLIMKGSYQFRECVFINHYEEDSDRATASLEPAVNAGTGFEVWDEVALKTEREAACAPGQGRAVSLAWASPGCIYRVNGMPTPESAVEAEYLDSMDMLSFRAGQAYDAKGLYNIPGSIMDFTVRLVVAGRETAPVHVSDYTDLVPPVSVERSNYISWYDATSTILDSVRIPLGDFQPGLRASMIEGLEMEFDSTGWILVDDLQFTRR